MADFANVVDWAPFVERSYLTTNGKLGVGSRRVLEHEWGFSLEEEVTAWDPGTGLSYSVFGVPYPVDDFQESWDIAPTENGTTVTTRVTYDVRLGALGTLIDWLVIRHLVRRAIRIGHRGLKWRMEAMALREC